MQPIESELFRKLERIVFRCLIVSFAILMVWSTGLFFFEQLVITVHAKFIGIGSPDLDKFEYDAKLINYQLMGFFKLSATILFFIPWSVLRLSRKSLV
tara:strand:+ start:245 stop:538 length:294 start_codon:yes stop_codon:yes gene_type:complete